MGLAYDPLVRQSRLPLVQPQDESFPLKERKSGCLVYSEPLLPPLDSDFGFRLIVSPSSWLLFGQDSCWQVTEMSSNLSRQGVCLECKGVQRS